MINIFQFHLDITVSIYLDPNCKCTYYTGSWNTHIYMPNGVAAIIENIYVPNTRLYTDYHCILATENHFNSSHAHRYVKFISSMKPFWKVSEEKQSGLST